ncbi:MAG: anthranilate phosphoribosyltransferase, partial [Proteobacteria bacterium]|nr:anthranilate phosphoribosyltransferase [Pseudomonadota bacterium]
TLVQPMAEALMALGTENALVVWGDGGLDELSLSGPSQVARIEGGRIHRFTLQAADFGLSAAPLSEIKGGNKQENAALTLGILKGQRGPRRDIVLMNAGAALLVAGLVDTWRLGAGLAAELIDSGRTLTTLETIRDFA